jgi:citrate synthase
MAQGSISIYDDFEIVNSIDSEVYKKYDIKRGLRNADGTGVVAGATSISNVHGYVMYEGEKQPSEGTLTLRGYSIRDLVESAERENRFGFEEIAYLLLAGRLPNKNQLDDFIKLIDANRELPKDFCADMIMTFSTPNIMNAMLRSVGVLYSFDDNAEDDSPKHEIDTAISLISRLPRIMVLAYYAKRATFFGDSMIMHRFRPGETTAQTILSMLRPNREYTDDEAKLLDIMLMLHAEHGGGNNSTFVCRVLTSTNTDPYSAYAAAVGSLKGSRHGGANMNVDRMQHDIMKNVSNWEDESQVADYLRKIVNKEVFDKSGLIYGMGHAIYTLSDPRAVLCKKYAQKLAQGTEFEKEFNLLQMIEQIAPDIIAEKKGAGKKICANIDMYSGFVYRLLGIPEDLHTPLFASSRIVGWAAHRFEEIVSGKRIIRPGYKSVVSGPSHHMHEYTPIGER